MQRSLACLLDEQAAEVEQLLIHYVDVFSKGNNDLHRTNLVKYHIHTNYR